MTPLADKNLVVARRPLPVDPDSKQRPAPPPLAVESRGDEVWGAAPGVTRRQLRDLRTRRYSEAEILDLHGARREDAIRAVESFLRAAAERRAAAVLLITGKGRHSSAGPVLWPAIVRALSTRFAGEITGFTHAGPKHGGVGALCVRLRR